MPMHNRGVTNGPASHPDLFAAVVDGAGVGIVVLDRQRRVVLANAAFCSLLECANEDLAGIDEREITDDTDGDLFRELLAGTRTRYTTDKPYRYNDGPVIWGRVTMTLRGDYA